MINSYYSLYIDMFSFFFIEAFLISFSNQCELLIMVNYLVFDQLTEVAVNLSDMIIMVGLLLLTSVT